MQMSSHIPVHSQPLRRVQQTGNHSHSQFDQSIESEDEPPDNSGLNEMHFFGNVENENLNEFFRSEKICNDKSSRLNCESLSSELEKLIVESKSTSLEKSERENDQKERKFNLNDSNWNKEEKEGSVTSAFKENFFNDEEKSKSSEEELPEIDIYYSSHPLVRLRPCENKTKGLGLFAIGKIKKGEVVWRHTSDKYGRSTGKMYTKEEILDKWSNDLEWFFHWAYRCGENTFLGPVTRDNPTQEATYYQNHSCDPSTWWEDEVTLTARRDIEPGEEITYDYGTSEADEEELGLIGCLCGSEICRGEIRGDDHLRLDLIERYGSHFQPYLRERVKKHMEMITGKPWQFQSPNREG